MDYDILDHNNNPCFKAFTDIYVEDLNVNVRK